MKVSYIVKKYLLLSFAVLCSFLTGCAGKDTKRTDMESWIFQAARQTEETDADDHANVSERDLPEIRDAAEEVRTDSGRNAEESEELAAEAAFGYVYVCGAVNAPGVYEITEDMRVFEVLELAGGMTEEADLDWINQALTVSDGQQLRIYTKEETQQMRENGQAAAENSQTAVTAQEDAAENKVNINTADRDLLMTLPGIGEAKADAILNYRQEHGAFDAIEEICQISGIKDAVFSNIKDRITV